MSRPFSFPPPPPPPPKRENPALPNPRGGFRGGGSSRGHSSYGPGPNTRGYGSYRNARFERKGGNPEPTLRPYAPKRDFATAFKPQSSNKPTAPPAVPSFDVDISSLLPKNQIAARPDITKRKGNVLGLTPAKDDESDAEDDADEEAKLSAPSLQDGIRFEHRGQTLSLRTPAEIAAWIAERKKRYPTQAKAEAAKREAAERKRQWEEQKQIRDKMFKAKKEARDLERNERERRRLKDKLIATKVAEAKSTVAERKDKGGLKAKQKAERLRAKAEEVARQLKIAEDRLRQFENPASPVTIVMQSQDMSDTESNSFTESDEEDNTSSSGSSETDARSVSGPEEVSSKQVGPARVAPTKSQITGNNTGEQLPCKTFARLGRCKYGRKCRFSHDKQKKPPTKATTTTTTQRKGLYEIMADKEKEEEMGMALKAIIALGEQGALDEPQHKEAVS